MSWWQSHTLYVGNLSSDTSESHLYEEFSKTGLVAMIRVSRDNLTRRSLGFAYVNYHFEKDAERALNTLNGTIINGRSCKLAWYNTEIRLNQRGPGSLFVKNLAKDVDNNTLLDLFSPFGKVVSAIIAINGNSEPLGYGYVNMDTKEEADDAISKLDGKEFHGINLKVEKYISAEERNRDKQRYFTNLFVKNLPESVDEAQLKEIFSEFGTVNGLLIARDRSGASKCYGYVNFAEHNQAAKAIEKLNNTTLKDEDKPLMVTRALSKADLQFEARQYPHQSSSSTGTSPRQAAPSSGQSLYITHLPDDFDEDTLKNEFVKFGPISSVKVCKPFGKRGYGFVCFRNPQDSAKALQEMNDRTDAKKTFQVALAYKDEKQILRNSNWGQPQGQSHRVRNSQTQYTNWNNHSRSSRKGASRANNNNTGPTNTTQNQTVKEDLQTPVTTTEEKKKDQTFVAPKTEEDIQALGEQVLELLAKDFPERAGNIVGMFLERYSAEQIKELLHNPTELKEQAHQANQAILDSQANQDIN